MECLSELFIRQVCTFLSSVFSPLLLSSPLPLPPPPPPLPPPTHRGRHPELPRDKDQTSGGEGSTKENSEPFFMHFYVIVDQCCVFQCAGPSHAAEVSAMGQACCRSTKGMSASQALSTAVYYFKSSHLVE